MSPITGISEEPLGTGRLFATSPPDTAHPDTGELFATEMDDALARQGGERSLESRQADVRARRAVRRESFEGEVSEAGKHADDHEALELPGEGAAAPAVARTTLPTEGGGALEGPAPSYSTPSYKEGASPSALAPSGGSSEHPTPGAAAAPPQLELVQLARMAAQSGGKATGMQPVHAASDARVESTTQAFLDAARGSSTKGTARSAAASPTHAMSDPELVERANEIMRQIRLNIAPGATQVTLNLEPAHLGRLWIRMSFRGGKLGAHVRAEKQETLDAIGPKLDELRQLFADKGIEADTIELELGFREGSSDSQPESFTGRVARSASQPDHPLRAIDERNPASDPPRRVSSDADGIDTYA